MSLWRYLQIDRFQKGRENKMIKIDQIDSDMLRLCPSAEMSILFSAFAFSLLLLLPQQICKDSYSHSPSQGLISFTISSSQSFQKPNTRGRFSVLRTQTFPTCDLFREKNPRVPQTFQPMASPIRNNYFAFFGSEEFSNRKDTINRSILGTNTVLSSRYNDQ